MNGSSPHKAATPGSLRELAEVAIPLIFSAGSMMLMHFIDRIYLTWYDSSALAASTPAGMLNWTTMAVPIGTVAYVNSFISQYHGADRPDRISRSIWQAVYLGLIFYIAILPFAGLAWYLIPFFGHAPEVVRMERAYYLAMILTSLPMILKTALSAFYSGRGETGVILKVNLLMVSINVTLDPILIYGFGPVPELGIAGAGLATFVTMTVGVGAYVGLLSRQRERELFRFWKERTWDAELIRRMIRYGFPSGMQSLFDAGAFTLFLFMVGRLSQNALAATNLAFNLNTLVFIPMLGVGTAITVLVGRHIGEGRPDLASRTTWMAMIATGSIVLLFCGVYIVAPEHLLSPFRYYANPEEFAQVQPLVLKILKFVAIYSLFDVMLVVFGSAIRSAGDTRVSFLVNLCSGWFLMVLPVVIMESQGILTLSRCWYACTANIVVSGLIFLLRFQYGPWREMQVIEAELIPDSLESHDREDSPSVVVSDAIGSLLVDVAIVESPTEQ
ncbi:MAG: MATE family efflux transporter [Planctomycetaceae bacterium]|nr:MATE family efflux transporter [Planctomycetaceae bacterium]